MAKQTGKFNSPTTQNSAGRLLAILTSIPDGRAYRQTLPAAFDAICASPSDANHATFQILVQLQCLYTEFLEDLDTSPMISQQTRDVMKTGLKSISDILTPSNLDAGIRNLSDAERSLLQVCATMIPVDAEVTPDDIARIREAIAELRTIVISGEIHATLRKSLLELIRLAEDAISRFSIMGVRGFKKAFKAMMGEASVLFATAKETEDPEVIKKSKMWAAVVNAIRTIDDIAARALKYKPLLEQAAVFMLGNSDIKPPGA